MREELDLLNEKQIYCLKNLNKFGVDPDSVKDRENGDYWKWYSHWDNWKKDMGEEEWLVFDKKMSNKEDVSLYEPKTKWND